jgi:hypothetical protein
MTCHRVAKEPLFTILGLDRASKEDQSGSNTSYPRSGKKAIDCG